MTIKIDQKIVGYQIRDDKEKEQEPVAEQKEGREKAEIIRMHEKLERPEGMECLEGATYKIRTPLDDHALYVTRSEEHTSELQSRGHLVCRLLLDKQKSRPTAASRAP